MNLVRIHDEVARHHRDIDSSARGRHILKRTVKAPRIRLAGHQMHAAVFKGARPFGHLLGRAHVGNFPGIRNSALELSNDRTPWF